MRPTNIRCIQHATGETWCGLPMQNPFPSIEEAIKGEKREVCLECAEKIIQALKPSHCQRCGLPSYVPVCAACDVELQVINQ